MKKNIIAFLGIFAMTSCGTLISGKTQSVNLISMDSSSKTEAEITNGKIVQNINLPSSTIVPRSRQVLTINVKENDCHKASTTMNQSKFNWVTLLNIFGGTLSTSSTSTDAATGALWSYDDNIYVNTQKKDGCKNN